MARRNPAARDIGAALAGLAIFAVLLLTICVCCGLIPAALAQALSR